MSKPRVRYLMNTRTEVHADRRTRRLRTRTDEERFALEQELYNDDECDGLCRAGRYCVQHGDL